MNNAPDYFGSIFFVSLLCHVERNEVESKHLALGKCYNADSSTTFANAPFAQNDTTSFRIKPAP